MPPHQEAGGRRAGCLASASGVQGARSARPTHRPKPSTGGHVVGVVVDVKQVGLLHGDLAGGQLPLLRANLSGGGWSQTPPPPPKKERKTKTDSQVRAPSAPLHATQPSPSLTCPLAARFP